MITNFFRINLPFESFQIQRLSYTDEHLHRLKAQYNKTASFFRHEDFLYISPSRNSGLELGDLVTLEVSKSVPIVLSLIRHLVFRVFRDAAPKRIPQGFSPLRFFSTRPENDAIRRLLPPELAGRIRYPRMIEVEARQIVEGTKPVFGLLIRSRQRWQFDVSLEELQADGFSLVGKTVLETHIIPGLEGILAPDESLLGQVQSDEGSQLVITTNNGIVARETSSLQLQRTRQQIGAYLAHKLGESSANRVFDRLREDQKGRDRPGFYFMEATAMAEWFISNGEQARVYENDDGFCFTVEENNNLDRGVSLHRTNLIFDYGPGASANTPLAGLKNHGPFNAVRFAKNDLRMLVVYHKHSRGAVTQCLKRLIDGIPDSRYFQLGLKALFRLNSVEHVLKEVNNSSPAEYEHAIDKAIKEVDGKGYDIALIECSNDSKLIPTPIILTTELGHV